MPNKQIPYAAFEFDGIPIIEIPVARGALSYLPKVNVQGKAFPDDILSEMLINVVGDTLDIALDLFKDKYRQLINQLRLDMAGRDFVVFQQTRAFQIVELPIAEFGTSRYFIDSIFSLGGFWSNKIDELTRISRHTEQRSSLPSMEAEHRIETT